MNSLRSVSRLPIRRLTNTLPLRTTTNISGGSMGRAWADKEHAAESQYFNKKDAELLAELSKKLHKHTEPDETILAAAKADIVAICEKHNVQASEAFVEEIVKFKFNH